VITRVALAKAIRGSGNSAAHAPHFKTPAKLTATDSRVSGIQRTPDGYMSGRIRTGFIVITSPESTCRSGATKTHLIINE